MGTIAAIAPITLGFIKSAGIDVVLTLGIVLAAILDMLTNDYQLSAWINDHHAGFSSMQHLYFIIIY